MLASDCYQLGGALALIKGQKQQRREWLTSRRVTKEPVGDANWDLFEEAVHRNISAQDQYLIAVKFSVDEMIAVSHLVRCWLRCVDSMTATEERRNSNLNTVPVYSGSRDFCAATNRHGWKVSGDPGV